MQATGNVNVLIGLMGGHIGSHSPGLVSLNKESGTTSRTPGVAQALILLVLWLSGFPLTNLLPRFLLGGVGHGGNIVRSLSGSKLLYGRSDCSPHTV